MHLTDWQLRPAMSADIASIAIFQTACWQEAYRGLVPQDYLDRVTVADRERRWRTRLVSRAREIVLAEQRDEVIGVVSWGTTDVVDVPALELMSLYVGAEHRGTGVATELIDRALGAAPAHLWVFDDNPRAQRFYAKHGFADDASRTIDAGTSLGEQRWVRW